MISRNFHDFFWAEKIGLYTYITHSVEFTKFLYHLKFISWNQLHSKLFTEEVVFTKIFQKIVVQKFRKNPQCETAQCGNYCDLVSHIFGKNFVKLTVLLKKLLKSWFDEIFFWWDQIFRFSTLWTVCNESYWNSVKSTFWSVVNRS